ncbi:MAG: phosphatidylglycerol lysyltransferase domain-containing protein [Capsulimonadaceae bacterium]|nr:phosphatidylglycerol lysyltransferase domain-containing protein [Capsulimonadaceae bacterium]
MNTHLNNWLNRLRSQWRVWLVVACLGWVVVTQHRAMIDASEALTHGAWVWLVPAALLQILYYSLYGVLYWSAFRVLGVVSRTRELINIVLASLVVSVAAPGGTAIGAALFVDDAVRRGQSGARAAVGTAIVVLAELLGVACISLAGLYLLPHGPSLGHPVIAAIATLGLFVLLLCGLIGAALSRPSWVGKAVRLFGDVVGATMTRIRRQTPLTERWLQTTSRGLLSAVRAMRRRWPDLIATFLISLVMFAVMLATLAMLFPAFGQPLNTPHAWSMLCAGFVVGMLFWIVSPTPQGIGFVEAGIYFTLHTMGMDKHVALWISLSFRALSFWIPLIAGIGSLRVLGAKGSPQPTRSSRNVRILALLIGGMGIINVLSAVHPALRDRFSIILQYLPVEVARDSRLASTFAGFVMLLVGSSLWRRKRAAWMIAVAALAISVVTHLIKGLDYEEASLAAALLIYLITQRSKFYASSDPPSVSQGMLVAGAAAVFTIAYAVTGLWVLDYHFKVNYGMIAAFKQAMEMFTGTDGPDLVPTTRFGVYFRNSVYGVAAGTLTYALLMILRPVLLRPLPAEAELQRASDIVARYGRSPLARFALFRDKTHYFSSGGSLIAYTLIGRTAIALGDPIGPEDDALAAIRGFVELCQTNDWRLGFYQTRSDYLAHYAACGLHSLCIGHDAVVDLRCFSTAGGSNKQIRWSLNRFTKLGYHAEVFAPPHSPTLIAKLREVSDEWLLTMSGAEKRFSLGWFDESYLQSCRIMVVIDPDLSVSAFANILPAYGDNETTVDMMRRRREALPGIMEFLFVRLLEWARDEGFKTFNLGLSPLSGLRAGPQDPAVERVLNYVYEHMNQFYSFKGLHTFKSKYKPFWEPRYLIYPSATSLPQVGLAIIHANSGGTYLKALFAAIRASMKAKKRGGGERGQEPDAPLDPAAANGADKLIEGPASERGES